MSECLAENPLACEACGGKCGSRDELVERVGLNLVSLGAVQRHCPGHLMTDKVSRQEFCPEKNPTLGDCRRCWATAIVDLVLKEREQHD